MGSSSFDCRTDVCGRLSVRFSEQGDAFLITSFGTGAEFCTLMFCTIGKLSMLHTTVSFWKKANLLVDAKDLTNRYEKWLFFMIMRDPIVQLSSAQDWMKCIGHHLNTLHIYRPATSITFALRFLSLWTTERSSVRPAMQQQRWSEKVFFMMTG